MPSTRVSPSSIFPPGIPHVTVLSSALIRYRYLSVLGQKKKTPAAVTEVI